MCTSLKYVAKNLEIPTIATMPTQWSKSDQLWGHPKQHLAYEFQSNWSGSFSWKLFTRLKTCSQQTRQLGNGNVSTTWHNKNMGSDAVDFATVMPK